MKSCPTCNRTYEDTFTFCLVDGAILSAPFDPKLTQPRPDFGRTEPPPTEILNPSIRATNPAPSLPTNPTFTPASPREAAKGNGQTKLIVGFVVLLMLAGVVVAVGWNRWFGDSNSQAKRSDVENTNSSTSLTPVSSPRPSPAASSTPQSTPSPSPTPSLAKKIDITGNWTGTFANRDAILFINNQESDSFTGILKNTKGAIIAVSGRINPETRQVFIQENRVIEDSKDGAYWVLGSDSGTLSSDGRRMSGRGRDSAGHTYTWSFAK